MSTRQGAKSFVKSADTKTSVVNSRNQIDKLLKRYGASQIMVAEDMKQHLITVSFLVPDNPDSDAAKILVKLPVRIRDVYDALYGRPMKSVYEPTYRRVPDLNGYLKTRMEQAERVAWRNLVLWIDAALSAVAIRVQTVTEAFFAHAVVGPQGQRMVEVVETYQSQLGAGVQRLLTSGAEAA